MAIFHTANVGQMTSRGLMYHYVTRTDPNGGTDVSGYFFNREDAKSFAKAMNGLRSTKRDEVKYVAHTDHPKS